MQNLKLLNNIQESESMKTGVKNIQLSRRGSNFGLSHILFVLIFTQIISCTAQSRTSSISLFDGTTLNGWKTVNDNNASFWRVVDSTLVGGDGTTKITNNTYLYTTSEYGDFEFRCLFRLTGDHRTGLINSGIQYRSTIEDNNIIGYQADLGNGYWGDIYDEHRRGKLVSGDLSTLKHILNEDGWNSYIVRCIGNKHVTYINGVKTAEYIEEDPEIPAEGVIGIQLHSGGNAKIEIKHLTITVL